MGEGGVRACWRRRALPALAGLMIVAWCLWYLGDRPPAGVDPSSSANAVTEYAASAGGIMKRFGIAPEAASALPRSLDGTSVDGGFSIDAAGRFVPDRSALRLFDYFFSASGEESDHVIRGRILLHALVGGLGEPTVAQIAAVLDKYMDFRAAAKALAASDEMRSADMARRVARMREVQTASLGADLQRAFYGEESDIIDLDMQRMAVMRNGAVSENERQYLVARIDARLPGDVRDARAASAAPSELHRRVETLRASGASEAAIADARRATYGVAATVRLEALDHERTQWRERLARYRVELGALRSRYGTEDEGAYRDAVAALRERHFAEGEVIRVEALDSAGL